MHTSTDPRTGRSEKAVARPQVRIGPNLANRVAAAILLVISGFLFTISVGYGFKGTGDQVGAGFFPGIVTGGLVILSVLWLVQGAGKVDSDETASEALVSSTVGAEGTLLDPVSDAVHASGLVDEDGESAGETFGADGRFRVLFVVLWSAVTLPFADVLGMVIAISVYLAGLLTVVAKVRWWKALISSFVACYFAAYGCLQIGILLPDPLHLLAILD